MMIDYNKVDNGRELAFLVLDNVFNNNSYANIELNHALQYSKLNKNSRSFVTNLVYGTIKNINKVNFYLQQYLKVAIKPKDMSLLTILRLGVYSVVFTNSPNHAIVDDLVKISRKHGNDGYSKVVNGVLRNLVRNLDNLSVPSFKNHIEELSFEYSLPKWIIRHFIEEVGEENIDNLLKCIDLPKPINLRVNNIRNTREQLIERLSAADCDVTKGELSTYCIKYNRGVSINQLAAYNEGLCSVQEEASQLVAVVLSPNKGSKVLDMCAAPGGKTCHIAQLMNNEGYVLALDIYEHKTKLIESNAKRLAIDIIETMVLDGTKLDQSYDNTFDYILIDAPCSGLGVLGRRVDSRLNKKASDLESLSAIQKSLLDRAYGLLKPDGRMVYSTCTINKGENEDNFNYLINKYKDIMPCDLSALLNDEVLIGNNNVTAKKGYIKLLPHIHGTDGFFISCVQKVGE